jgi:5-methylcytosine-specific restriction endonuclease McrA
MMSKSRAEYKEYLLSKHWKDIKRRMYKKFKRCQKCGCTKKLNVHHLTYKNRGHENLKDLMLLCKSCHFREHRLKKPIWYWKPTDLYYVLLGK